MKGFPVKISSSNHINLKYAELKNNVIVEMNFTFSLACFKKKPKPNSLQYYH